MSYVAPDRESFEHLAYVPTERYPLSTMVGQTLELPISELSLDEAEVQPLEQDREQRAILRIDTSDPAPLEVASPLLQLTEKRTRASSHGTAMVVKSRIPWLACGIALFVSAAATALLFAR